jgi:hypothetical protein
MYKRSSIVIGKLVVAVFYFEMGAKELPQSID